MSDDARGRTSRARTGVGAKVGPGTRPYGATEYLHAEARMQAAAELPTCWKGRQHTGSLMRVCLTLSRVPALAETEESVFAFVELLKSQCDSISSCELFVEGACGDGVNPAGCTVRLALQAFGEHIHVTGTSLAASDDTPVQSALHSTYRDAVAALQTLARTHKGCSCHALLEREDSACHSSDASEPRQVDMAT